MPTLSLEVLRIAKESGVHQSLLDCLAGKSNPDPQMQQKLNELKKLVAKAIDALPETERVIVSLHYYEELTLKEIGEVFDITEPQAYQIYSNAVDRLGTLLTALIAEKS